MAYVADFTEDELRRALEAEGGAAPVESGPSGGPPPPSPGRGAPVGASPAAAAPGAGAGTGFVNLGQYFSANEAGAQAGADALVAPLKVDLAPIGAAAASGVAEPAAPTPVDTRPINPRDGKPMDVPDYSGGQRQAEQDAANAANQAAYQSQLAGLPAQRESASRNAMNQAAQDNLRTAAGYNDPTKRAEAMSKDGQAPSGFDSYLTGAALGHGYQGLLDYYAPGGESGLPGGRGTDGYQRPGTPPVPGAEAVTRGTKDNPADRPGPPNSGATVYPDAGKGAADIMAPRNPRKPRGSPGLWGSNSKSGR